MFSLVQVLRWPWEHFTGREVCRFMSKQGLHQLSVGQFGEGVSCTLFPLQSSWKWNGNGNSTYGCDVATLTNCDGCTVRLSLSCISLHYYQVYMDYRKQQVPWKWQHCYMEWEILSSDVLPQLLEKGGRWPTARSRG